MLEVDCVPSVQKQIDAIPVGAGFWCPSTSSACLVDLVLPFAAGLAFFERSCLRRRVCVFAVEGRMLAFRLAEAPAQALLVRVSQLRRPSYDEGRVLLPADHQLTWRPSYGRKRKRPTLNRKSAA